MSTYSIQLTSSLSGVSSHCIRAWERRYNAVVPQRDELGHRLYSKEDITRFVVLRKLSQAGCSISHISRLSDSELNDLLEKTGETVDEELKEIFRLGQHSISPNNSLSVLVMALDNLKIDIFIHELNKASVELTAKDLCLGILLPLLEKSTSMMLSNTLSEISYSLVLSEFKSTLYKKLNAVLRSEKIPRINVLVLSAPGKINELRGLVLGLLAAGNGCHAIFLDSVEHGDFISKAAMLYLPRLIIVEESLKNKINRSNLSFKEKAGSHNDLDVIFQSESNQFSGLSLGSRAVTNFSSYEELNQRLFEISNEYYPLA